MVFLNNGRVQGYSKFVKFALFERGQEVFFFNDFSDQGSFGDGNVFFFVKSV